MLDAYKELTPVVYGEHAIKHLYVENGAGRMCFQMHWHDRMELLYVTNGRLELHLDDRQAVLLAGQVAVIGPRMLHCGFAGEEGVSFHTIMFDVEKFYNETTASEEYLTALSRGETCFLPTVKEGRVVESVKQLVTVLTASEKRNPLLAVGAVYTIIGALYQSCTESFRSYHKTNDSFREVVEYVNGHYTEHISTRSLSKQFGYNETYFCRNFKSVTGINLMKYIQILRMELAQKVLRNTEKGIAEIALECGFTDISYFSNCFKKQLGVTPKEFRKMQCREQSRKNITKSS